MINPLTLTGFAEAGQKDPVPSYIPVTGYSPLNPNVHGYELNNIFNQIIGQLNFLKSKGLSVWQSDKAYVATAGEADIVRHGNKIYYAKLDSNTDLVTPKNPDTEPNYWGVFMDLDKPVVDNLTDNSTTSPLSANQGLVLKGMVDAINTLLTSNDVTLDELQEIVNYIKANRADLDALGISSIAGLQTALDAKASLKATDLVYGGAKMSVSGSTLTIVTT